MKYSVPQLHTTFQVLSIHKWLPYLTVQVGNIYIITEYFIGQHWLEYTKSSVSSYAFTFSFFWMSLGKYL